MGIARGTPPLPNFFFFISIFTFLCVYYQFNQIQEDPIFYTHPITVYMHVWIIISEVTFRSLGTPYYREDWYHGDENFPGDCSYDIL